jgi:hypothetical protein
METKRKNMEEKEVGGIGHEGGREVKCNQVIVLRVISLPV